MAVSLPINIALTLFCGYFLASKNVMFKKPILFLIMFTMFFSGGMIPAYLNVRDLGLYNTLWSLILPGAMSVYNAIICRTAIEAIPDSLEESAFIDGANDLVIVFRIVLPLIMPTIAVLLLYYGVGHWNAWFNASIYLKDNEKLPIQNVLRAVLIANSNILNSAAARERPGEPVRRVDKVCRDSADHRACAVHIPLPAEVLREGCYDRRGQGIKRFDCKRRLNFRRRFCIAC